MWILSLWIQPAADWKYVGGGSLEISPNWKLNLPYSSNYLHSIYIVSGVISSLETI